MPANQTARSGQPTTERIMFGLKTLALATALFVATMGSPVSAQSGGGPGGNQIQHILLMSVDGLHEIDLANWIAHNPNSNLAHLSNNAITFTHAHTTTPSDSFPGMLSMVTGGTPKTTGVYYDDSYDRTLYAPGSNCKGNPGIEVVYDESIEFDDSKLFSGGINPGNLPMQKLSTGQCVPVYPHSFLKTNTVFEVIKAAGGRTAWSDKHQAYDLLNGPSGTGIDDLYSPEVNSLIKNGGIANGVNLGATLALCNGKNSLPVSKVSDYTTCTPASEAYDDTKVQAVINEIDGLKSDGSAYVGVPTIFGTNFQEVSVTQKLPTGGYSDANGTPSANLNGAIAHVDQSIGRMVNELNARNLLRSTMIIISAKHGQSPTDLADLQMESGGLGSATVTDPQGFINAADPTVDTPSSFTNPNSGSTLSTSGHFQTDDTGLLWLQNQSASNAANVVAQLQAHTSVMHANTLPPGTIFSSSINYGNSLAAIYGDPTSSDPVASARAPNVIIQPNHGVIYSGSSKKVAEHGGGTTDDTNVAMMISLPSYRAQTISTPVSTAQIAPTILRALFISPQNLQSVRMEGTRALQGLYLPQ
jgi:hypothetical protein